MTITSKAPGKLFIAGEYAVVEPGHGAIIAAVSRYLIVTINEASSVGTLTSTQNPDLVVKWTREEELFRAKGEHPYNLVEEAILVAEQYVRETGKPTNALYSLSITSELDDAKRGIKYGLGSSGAVVVATIQAVLDFYETPRTPLLVYQLSVLTNLHLFQRGSFGDIAASSFGGMVYYTSPDRNGLLEQLQTKSIKELCDAEWKDLTIEHLPEIPNFTLLVGWTGQVAITDSLIQATEKKRKVATDSAFYKEFLKKSHAIVEDLQSAWNNQDIPALQEGIRANRALLNEFAQVMQLEIETPALQTLCNLAEKVGACAKTSGAGGGDCGICFTQNETQRQQIETQWAHAQIQVLPLTIVEAW
ncbi:phosphomevalonate kinase [uncultured Granulicatella sp.]|uniref:phosphomevalonate kinase n=1 Tax=uncultured Granulicatella sp. TaxID=316089 RepID=UPI002591FDDF|nr:phosphomevalonate kinase [uncultured Granulicatella sp.]